MDIISLFHIVILIVIHCTKTISVAPLTSDPPFSELKPNVSDPLADHLYIQLTVDSNRTSNLKNIIRSELTSTLKDFGKGRNCLTTDIFEDDSFIVPHSVEYVNLVAKLQTIENTLKDIKAENSKIVEAESIGVRCNSCSKTMKSQTKYPRNCKEAQTNGNNITGIYEIYPKNSKQSFPVLCDMDIRGGGWTHIQKRFDGSIDFFREWRDYKFGFGSLEGEFWLGLENIHLLTGLEPVELLVEVTDRGGARAYAHYSSFGIGPEPTAYKLERLSGFSGDAGDSLTHHFGRRFSAKDLDFSESKCSSKHLGGWWFTNCLWSNLNGKYINVDLPTKQFWYPGLYWYTHKDENCLAGSRMLVRTVN